MRRRPPTTRLRLTPLLIREITALVMPPNGVTNGPCNTSNPSNITAWLGHTAALTLSCVSPGQDAGVAPPGRRLPAPLPPRQGNRPSFYPVFLTPREARIGETQIPFGGSRSHCAAAQPAASRHQLNTPRAAAAAQRGDKQKAGLAPLGWRRSARNRLWPFAHDSLPTPP